jgi:Mg2+/Co2+ transporter CorB
MLTELPATLPAGHLPIGLTLTGVGLMLVLAAIFCAAETALLSSSKARLYQLARQGTPKQQKRALVALQLLKSPDQLLATILIVMTIVPVASSALTTSLLVQLFGPVGVAYATAGLGLAILLVGEAFPKAIGTRYPEQIALTLAIPMSWCVRGLHPCTIAIKAFNHGILRLLGLAEKSGPTFTAADIRGAINLGLEAGTLAPTQHRMLDAVLDLDELMVADVMVHRSAIAALDVNTAPADLPQVLGQLKHSRVVVYDRQPDQLLGILYVRDYLTALAGVANRHQVQLRQHLRPLYFVPETTPVGHQLLEFLRQHRHLALVVDEYGDLQGLITLEDILEEIVGEIADEHEQQQLDKIETAADGSITLRGNTPVRDANRAHGWNLPDETAVTLAGLMVETVGHLPAQGESVVLKNVTLTVTTKRGHRIEKITVTPRA